MLRCIHIKGAKTHNLKNIDVKIPRDELTVITGVSGSGKSSLAFDTLYAEGQRRYVESLSAYARQFLSLMEKPDVDHIDGLSPAIAIQQKSTSHNPRSTVGTVTEIYDYLRLLFARAGEPQCPEHGVTLSASTVSQMVDAVFDWPEETPVMVLAPLVQARKGEHDRLFKQCMGQGFTRVRVNGVLCELSDVPKLDPRKKNTIELVVDRLKLKSDRRQRLAESLELALAHGNDVVTVESMEGEHAHTFSAKFACPHCGYALSELSPRLFSFNSPHGACAGCDGLGVQELFDPEKMVFDDTLSLAQGAIKGWGPRHFYYYQMLKSLAKHYDFSMEKPFHKLPKRIRDIIMYGSEGEPITFEFRSDGGQSVKRKYPFLGISEVVAKRYNESDSHNIREELSQFLSTVPCDQCQGSRLNKSARHVLVANHTIQAITQLSIAQCHDFFKSMQLVGYRQKIAEKVIAEIQERLFFLVSVGLDYLSLGRSADSLSGGEAQRIRLASQVGSGLVGVTYVLDEPSIGLHQRDNQRLLATLFRLRDLGNTVVVVEHDEDAIRSADYVIDIGPRAGVHGGEVVASGTPEEIVNANSLTADYLSGRQAIEVPKQRVPMDKDRCLHLRGMTHHNLQSVDITIPAGLLTVVTGVSGSGKSSMINHTLYPLLASTLNRANAPSIGAFASIDGMDHFDKVIAINQSPIGRTPRSNPATYTGILTSIRELFAQAKDARARGYKSGRFSFNVKGGRCEVCQGDGVMRVEMHFLPDVYVDCDVCQGKRYNRETLEVLYKGKNIHQVLSMTVEEARQFFDAIPAIAKRCQTLMDVGLSYITLGQNAVTLSGGEAQRVKLAKELAKRSTGRTIYLLDEPTTGLHFHDVKQLLDVLIRLRDEKNTLVVIEHNLDVIKMADWIIDMGPEGGDGGGEVVAMGPPETILKEKRSHTAKFLAPLLGDKSR